MPTYEYRCARCGRFDVEQRMSDDALSTCPTCGEPVKRLIPRKLYIHFKGPGFHVNDYPSGHRAAADAAADNPSAPAKTTEAVPPTAAAEEKKPASE